MFWSSAEAVMPLYKLKNMLRWLKMNTNKKQIQSRDIIRYTFVAVFGDDEILDLDFFFWRWKITMMGEVYQI